MPEWLTIATLVDAAGIAGFVLSMILAVSQIWANRLAVRVADCILINPKDDSKSIFLYVCLCNKTNLPFSLVGVCIDTGKGFRAVPIERTVRTYSSDGGGNRAAVKPVVLSQAFPVRFDSYAAEVFLFEVLRQHIDVQILHPDGPDRSQEEHLRRQYLQIHRQYRHRHLPHLVLSTSRGRLSIPMPVSSVQDMKWLQTYAVQKAGHEEKLVFP